MSREASPYRRQEEDHRLAKKIAKRIAGVALATTAVVTAGAAINNEAKSDQYEPWYVGGNMPAGLEEGDEVTYIPGEHGGVINPIVRIGEDGKPTLVGFNAHQGAEDNQGERYLFDVQDVDDVDFSSAEKAIVKRDEVLTLHDIGEFSLEGVDASIGDGNSVIVGLPSDSYRAEQIEASSNS